MHSQGNYTKHLPPPPFHKNPAASASSFPLPPPPFHHGPVPPQTQGIQQGHGNCQLPPGGGFAYPHAPSSGAPPQHGSPALSGMISGNSYFTGPQPPQVHGNNQISHSFSTSGPQCPPWSQSVSQFPQTAHRTAPGTYPLPAPQGYTTEKGPTHQNPSQIPQPARLPTYASSLLRDDPYSSSMLAHPQPHFPPLGPLPPPPPLPTHSPPGAPPLPPSSPSDKLPKNDGGHSSMGHSAYGDNLVLDSPSPTTYTGGSSLLDRNEKAVKTAEAVAVHSPDDSDMDMEDDITQPDEVKQKNLSTNLNDACMSEELDKKVQFWESPNFEGNKVPNGSVDGNLVSAGSSASKDQRLGAEIRSGKDTSVDVKLCSEAHELALDGESGNLMDVVITKSPPREEKFSELTVAVAAAETGLEKPSSELKESADAFKLLEGYATDSSTDNREHFLGDVTPPSSKVESAHRDVKSGRRFWSESTPENASEPDKLDLSRSMIKSPRNLMGSDKSSSAAEELADNSHRNQESVPTDCGKSNFARLDVDEFGRLVREGVTDSDTSDTPRHTRKHVRRDRRRSRSNSVSPRDRRRSPRRRRERRGRSRSFSPRRRRSRTRSPVLRRRSRTRSPVLRRRSRTRSPVLRRRSRTRSPVLRRRSRTRSPVLRRGSDMVGDKNRRDKSQFAECFDFLRGKCYRGATCRFSHNEPHKTDMVKYNSGHEETNPDFHEKKPCALNSSVHENISIQDEGIELTKDMPSLKEIKVPETFPADSTVHSHDKLTSGETPLYTENVTPRNLSGHLSHYMPLGNESSYMQHYHFAGHPMQGMTHIHPVAQSQSNTLYSSMGVNVSSNTNASHSMPYFQPASYGLQYSTVSGASIQGEPANLSSSISRVAGDFLQTGPQFHQHDFVGSRISNHFNPYASTFEQPISTKFSSTASVQGNDKQFTPMYGASVGLNSVSIDANKIGIVTSSHLTPSTSSAIAAEALTTRPVGNQYDPLYDSIEQPLNSLTGAGLQNNEIIGDSDNFQRSSGSSKVLNRETVKQGGTGVSANDSLDLEEYGETADNIEVGDIVNGSPSTPNNPMEIHAGEIEIDQIKTSAKKKGKDTRSANLFKTSIASFVKEVLKPSWRQGNMSKEAFKTIVKKTVDKVSGAMKSHKIPRSQAKVNHYIDSSRGKLTKLVMGYVDKYVKM